MKMIKKLMIMLSLGLIMPAVQANTIINLMKSALGIAQDKVNTIAAYNDSLWFNVEQELHNPVARAIDKWNLSTSASSMIVAARDEGFSFESKHNEAQLVSHLLALMHSEKIKFSDTSKKVHCFEKFPYGVADRMNDVSNIRTMVYDAHVTAQEVQELLKPIFSKSYALDNDRKTIHDLSVRNGLEKAAQKITDDLLMRVSHNQKELVASYVNNKQSFDGFAAQLCAAIDAEIARTTEKGKKEEFIKAKAIIEKELYNVRKVVEALNVYVKATQAESCLGKLLVAVNHGTILENNLVEYNTFLQSEKLIAQKSELLAKDTYYQFVKSQSKIFDLAHMSDRTVDNACALQEALIAGTISDITVKNKNQYKTNFTLVQNAVRKSNENALNMLDFLMIELIAIDCISTEVITVDHLPMPFSAHIHRFLATYDFEKETYTTFVEKCMQQVSRQLEKNSSPELIKKYVDYMKQYAKCAVTRHIFLEIKKLYTNGRIQQLLTENKGAQEAVKILEKEKGLLKSNNYAKLLSLENDDIGLDAVRNDRGTTFASLAQKLSVSNSSSWKKASTIVTAGEKAHSMYAKVRAAYRNVFEYAGKYMYNGTTALFTQHVETIVSGYISLNGHEVDLMQELNDMASEFVAHVDKANLTTPVRTLVKEEISSYIECIKASLKAQIIAGWYTHDVAWKMDSEKMSSVGGAILNGLRKLTPTSGSSTLEPLS